MKKLLIGSQVLAVLLSGCGGGGGGGESSSALPGDPAVATAPAPTTTPPGTTTPSASTAFTSVGSTGELLTYTVDTAALTYAYTITDSQYGLNGVSGQGALTASGNGLYMPQGMTNEPVFPANNGMLIGEVDLTINGAAQRVHILGASNPVASLSAAQGTYNYVQRTCTDTTQTICATSYGTFRVNADGTWVNCIRADYDADPTGNCGGNPRYAGTLNSSGNGTWQLLSGGSVLGGVLISAAANGQNVALFDLTGPSASGGLGIGMAAGASRAWINAGDTDGNWVVTGDNGTLHYSAMLATSGNSYTATTTVDGSSTPQVGSSTFAANLPWPGFITTQGGGVGILTGAGVYAGAGGGYFELGLKM